MARKPNYDFERKERERAKAAKVAEKAAAKAAAEREQNPGSTVQDDESAGEA